MFMLRLVSYGIVTTAALVSFGCGDSSDKNVNPAPDAGDAVDGAVADGGVEEEKPPIGAASGQVAVRVDQARRATTDGDVGYVNVAFTLANGAGAPPASLNAALFSLRTSTGLYVTATTSPGYWVDGEPCNPSVAVGAGASASCTLTFELEEATPVELYYQTAGMLAGTGTDQRSATAPLALEPCTPCGDDCTYLDRDRDHCGACDNTLARGYSDQNNQDVLLDCHGGKPACPAEEELTLCNTVRYDPGVPGGTPVIRCTDVKTSERNCGACGKVVTHGECIDGLPVCATDNPSYTMCADKAYCVDLSVDTTNCGTCGHDCEVSPSGKGIIQYGRCGESVGGQCASTISLAVERGDSLIEGQTCAKACVVNGFMGCVEQSTRCSSMVGPSLSIDCPCFW